MKGLWAKYAAKIDALSPRERAIVFVAGVLIAIAIVYFVAIDPVQRRQRVLLAQIEQERTEIATLENQRRGGPKQADPDAASRARAEALRQQIGALDDTLKALQRELVPAERVNTLLQEMLARDNRLTLVSLRTLPAEPLAGRDAKPPASAGAAPAPAPPKRESGPSLVYKHGVEITIQGSYGNLHDYLVRLERSPWRMYWWRAHLTADEQARLTLTVTVYTLSLDKAWLQV